MAEGCHMIFLSIRFGCGLSQRLPCYDRQGVRLHNWLTAKPHRSRCFVGESKLCRIAVVFRGSNRDYFRESELGEKLYARLAQWDRAEVSSDKRGHYVTGLRKCQRRLLSVRRAVTVKTEWWFDSIIAHQIYE